MKLRRDGCAEIAKTQNSQEFQDALDVKDEPTFLLKRTEARQSRLTLAEDWGQAS